jgi:rhamnogalacturonyl hydrolase YesR
MQMDSGTDAVVSDAMADVMMDAPVEDATPDVTPDVADTGPTDMPPVIDELPTKAQILSTIRLVNDHWIAGHADSGNNLWARAVYFVGNMKAYEATQEQGYLTYASAWAEKHSWGLNEGNGTRFADNQIAGQTYIWLNELSASENKLTAIEASLSAMVNSEKADDWWWCDALFMAMPAFTKLGVLRSDTSYFDKMHDLFTHSRSIEGGGLYDEVDHLWWRDKGFVAPAAEPNGKDTFWSRGNGWVFAALARTLNDLPASDPNRAEYQQMYLDMAAALLAVQREDGFWNVSLHDPTNYGGPETSGTALFSFGFAWGINNELLDIETYGPALANAWNAMVTTAVHEDGFLGYIQDVGYAPFSSQPVTTETTSDFGVGVFLLAGSEILALAPES